MYFAKVRTAWKTFHRHYDDLTPHERKRVLQRMACDQVAFDQMTPALQSLVAGIELAASL